MDEQNVVLITGVSSGLGKGLAEIYLQSGWNVLGLSRRTPETLISTPGFVFKGTDLADVSDTEAGIHELTEGVPKLDLVILNAGILGQVRDMRATSLKTLHDIMQTNVWANKIILDALFRAGKEVAQVVAISSGASVNGNRGWAGYAISKASLNMLIQLYAQEEEGTHFTSLAPGLIDTAMQDYLCDEVDAETYVSVKRLKAARGTEDMPDGRAAAEKVQRCIPGLLNMSSGSYADIRKLPFDS
ncbi:MAG: SDR family NAD(P)-dependent oxidoreductase [Verrucomicrobiota bacterium]